METKQFKLELQIKQGGETEYQPFAGMGVLVSPDVDEDYWLFRVPVSDKQAIVGFPKYGLLGIGFQHEGTEWNVNLPSDCDPYEIYEHIKKNKGEQIPKTRCIKAIRMIQEAWNKVK